MKYYSTNHSAPATALEQAVIRGLAPDKGLYMPESINRLDDRFFKGFDKMTLPQIAYNVAEKLFGEDIEPETLRSIVADTLDFPIPLKKVEDNIYVLELFHGPTLAFKDVGARFMARLLGHFIKSGDKQTVNVLVATSGDTGSAVANGFLGVEGVKVFVLYPKGKVSPLQEAQFTTLGNNITAIEVDGTFDDCQAMVKSAFVDDELTGKMKLTSANSINPARFLPQMFYYFGALAQLKAMAGVADVESLKPVVAVPSGNLGNICSAVIGTMMGLPIHRFIAANNSNDVFTQYLDTAVYAPRESHLTIANAMDVGAPSNFARLFEIFKGSHADMSAKISGRSFTDDEIAATIKDTLRRTGYLLDPHGATAYRALKESLQPGETGIFLETAHPAKFKEVVEKTIGQTIDIPEKLSNFMGRKKETVSMAPSSDALKSFLLTTI